MLVAVATAVYWDATDVCADCSTNVSFEQVLYYLAGGEGFAAGVLFFLGGIFGLLVASRPKNDETLSEQR